MVYHYSRPNKILNQEGEWVDQQRDQERSPVDFPGELPDLIPAEEDQYSQEYECQQRECVAYPAPSAPASSDNIRPDFKSKVIDRMHPQPDQSDDLLKSASYGFNFSRAMTNFTI